MNADYFYERLKDVKVIDTHEHLWDESWRLENPGDWTGLFYHYGITALKTAGMTAVEADELYSAETSHERKWQIFSRYFGYAKNAAYIKAALIAIRDIYGVDRVDGDSMQELTAKIRSAVHQGFNRRILKDMAGIDYCMVNCLDHDEAGERFPLRTWGDLELMKPDLFADNMINPSCRGLMERETNTDCSTLDGWLKAINAYFDRYAQLCCSVKIGLGYAGYLGFDPSVTGGTAGRYYNDLVNGVISRYDEIRPLVDYLFFYILGKAVEYKLPLKFHTGLYSGADHVNFDAVEGNVRHLAKLATAHPECRFIAMHIAYPFQDEMVMAVRQVSNLYADMSWAWIVDTEAAGVFLKQVLTAAPVTKVMGFGGDYALAENVYGHLEIARRAIAGVLKDMTCSGYFDAEEALEAGRFILKGSAERLYGQRGAI